MALQDFISGGMDVQGFSHLSAEEKRRLQLPLRFGPLLCGSLLIASVIAQYPTGFYALAVVAALGVVMPRAPFDLLYAAVLNPILKTGVAPRSTPQRRFACGMGAMMFTLVGYLFSIGNIPVATGLGIMVASMMTAMGTVNFCMASWMYNMIPGMPGRYVKSKSVTRDASKAA